MPRGIDMAACRTSNGNGKGDAWRKTNFPAYRSNYENVFDNFRRKHSRRHRSSLSKGKSEQASGSGS